MGQNFEELRALIEERDLLRHENEQLKRTLSINPSGIVVFDPAGDISFANLRAEELLELSKTDLERDEYNPPPWQIADERGVLLGEEGCLLRTLVLSEKPIREIRVNLLWPDGKQRKMVASLAPLRTPEGAVDGGVAVFDDVTNRLRLEDQQRTRAAQYRRFFESSYLGVFHFSESGDLLDVNPKGCELFGFMRDELIKAGLRRFVHPDDEGRFEQLFNAVLEGRSFAGAIRFYDALQREMHTELHGVSVVVDDNPSYWCTIRDVTEALTSQLNLRRSEALFRGVFEQSDLGLALVDGDGRLARVNDETCRIFARDPKELIGKRIGHLFRTDDAHRLHKQLELLRGGILDAVGETAMTIRRDDGERSVQFGASLVRDVDGAPLQFIARFQDITDRKRIHDLLERSEEQYRALVENLPDGILEVDERGEIRFANRHLPTPKGTNLIGKNVFDFLDQRSRRLLAEALHAVELSSDRPACELTWIPQAGDGEATRLYARITSSRGQGTHRRSLIIFTEITDPKATEDPLESSPSDPPSGPPK